MAALLADEGYETLHVPDDRAREAVVNFAPDLVIADMWVPGTDGLKLFRDFLREERCPAFIVVSSFASFSDCAREAGADAFLLKPVNLDTLLASIERAISRVARDAERAAARPRKASQLVLPR